MEEKDRTEVEVDLGVMTTYDPLTDTFGHATMVIGGPFASPGWNIPVDEAIRMVGEARRRHGVAERDLRQKIRIRARVEVDGGET